jgi:ABC-type bacteriocin/lantibiotic exporter with double-glycine peptidase domain
MSPSLSNACLASTRFTVEVKSQALGRLLGMPLEFLGREQSGYLVRRLNEVDALSGLFSPTIFQLYMFSVGSLRLGAFRPKAVPGGKVHLRRCSM